jgi:predicted GIY-YIG superfamily endonuclease
MIIIDKPPFEYKNKLDWVPDLTGFVAYVLMLDNGMMYKGYTGGFKTRMLAHFNGGGCSTTRRHSPVYILHHEEYDSKAAAMAREQFFKSGDGFYWLKAGQFLKTIKPLDA